MQQQVSMHDYYSARLASRLCNRGAEHPMRNAATSNGSSTSTKGRAAHITPATHTST